MGVSNMGRGTFGTQQGVARAIAARQQTAAAVSVSPADAIRESLRNDGHMELAAFNKLSDDDMAAIIQEIDQYESDDDLNWRHLRPTDTQRFFNQIGWADEKPQVLSETAYETARVAAGAKSLYHTDNPYGSYTTTAMMKQFRTATQYLSGGIHGDGTYLAEQAWDSWNYGSHSTAIQQKMFLNQHAKVIQKQQIRSQLNAWKSSHPKAYQQLANMSQGYADKNSGDTDGVLSVFAAMQGYNVIKTGSYYTVLNRKAVTVSESHKMRKNTNTSNNW